MAPKQKTTKAPAKKESPKVTAASDAPAAKKKRITLAPEGIIMAEEAAAKKAARKAPVKQTKEQAVAALKVKAAEAAAASKKQVAKKKKKITIDDGEGSDNEDNVSVDLELSDDEDGNVKIPKAKKGEKKKERHTVLQLRHLPKEFEEPQLIRFFSQFNANVISAFCLRSKRNHQSLGTAFVQFDKPSVLPTVIDECHGMLLGGRTVRARRVRINRALPTKKAIVARMNRAHAIEARGVKMNRFDLGKKQQEAAAADSNKVVGYLIKYARTERDQVKRLKDLGIDYSFDGFSRQLAKVHKSQFAKKEKTEKKEEEEKKTTAKK